MQRDHLKIAEGLWLPADTAATSTLVGYGGKGMGKTNLGAVIVEEMSRCGIRWSWLDPLGVSWGLRHSANGKGPGVECVIMGGTKGDVPIEPEGGAAVADIVVEESFNVVIDFSRKASGEMWSTGEKIRFVTAYAHRLFQRQGQITAGKRRDPIFQVLDEAARYIPQVIPSGSPEIAKCVGAWEQLVEEGRNVGIGVGLLTQRSARMNKSVSELADVMFAFRTIGPNSLEAVLDWLGQHVDKAKIKLLAEQVRALDRGSALVVSPGYLKVEKVVRIRLRETFDSSATVKVGQARRATGVGARPDLEGIKTRMAQVIERSKAEDPRELRKTVQKQAQEIVALRRQSEAIVPTMKRLEGKAKPAPTISDSQIKRVERAIERLRDGEATFLNKNARQIDTLSQRLQVVTTEVGTLATMIGLAKPVPAIGHVASIKAGIREMATAGLRSRSTLPDLNRKMDEAARGIDIAERETTTMGQASRRYRTDVPRDSRVSRPQQEILDALAYFESVHVTAATRRQAALVARVSSASSGFEKNVGTLRTLGLIELPGPALLRLTETGRAAARAPEVPPTPRELHEALYSRLSRPQADLLRVLIGDVSGRSATREYLAKAAGVSASSSGFEKNVGTLRALGLITYPEQGFVAADPVLFL